MNFDPDSPPPYSVKTLAARWNCSPSMIRKLIKAGKLSCFSIGNLIRIPRSAVHEYETGAGSSVCTESKIDLTDSPGDSSDDVLAMPSRKIKRKPRGRSPLKRAI